MKKYNELDKREKELLETAKRVMVWCQWYYQSNTFTTIDDFQGMCAVLYECLVSNRISLVNRVVIWDAFESTDPNDLADENKDAPYWYPLGEIQPRIDHLQRIINEIDNYIDQE